MKGRVEGDDGDDSAPQRVEEAAAVYRPVLHYYPKLGLGGAQQPQEEPCNEGCKVWFA